MTKQSLSSFTFFYRYLFSKRANSIVRRVSFICFLGLIISIGSLLIVFNVMGGLGQSVKERFLATEPHVIVSFEHSSSPDFIQNQKDKVKELLGSSGLDSGVSSFYFFESIDMVIRTQNGVFSGAVAKGYSSSYLEDFLRRMQGETVLPMGSDILDDIADKEKYSNEDLSGKQNQKIKNHSIRGNAVRMGNEKIFFVENKKSRENKKKIIMGFGLANELDVYEGEKVHLIPAENLLLPPGEPIQFESAQVGSVISTQNAVWNSSHVFYDRSYFPSFRESSSYRSGFEMRLNEPEDFLLYKTALEDAGFSVEVWPERNSSVFFALKVEKIIMSIFLSLAGLITLLAVSSLLVLLMVQKKKEMGVLMAMGLSTQKIHRLFVGIGLLLSSFGMLGAFLFSLCVCLFLKYSNIPILAQFHAEASFPVEFNIPFMLFLFVGIFCLAFVGCVLSVRSQSRYSPAELLKTVNS